MRGAITAWNQCRLPLSPNQMCEKTLDTILIGGPAFGMLAVTSVDKSTSLTRLFCRTEIS